MFWITFNKVFSVFKCQLIRLLVIKSLIKELEYTLNDEKLTSISSKSFFSFTEKPSVAFLVDDI